MKEHVSRFDRHLVRTSSLFFLSLSLGLIGNFPTQAQVISDGTVGTVVTGDPNFTIEGGTRPGNGPNLFHSFQEFSVPMGGSSFFDNAPDVVNIISRVTGSNLSNIDGLIQANGNANLILINPAGITFGPNASLNLGGSFLGTTASSLKFADGVEFSAVHPTGTPLLTVAVPIGLQMGSNPGTIAVQGIGGQFVLPAFFLPVSQTGPVGLQVNGGTLALIGGNVDLISANLAAPGGRVELGGVGGGATVGLTPTPQGYQFNYQNTLALSDVRLLGRSFVTASGIFPGSIQVQGRHISLQDGSLILVDNQGVPLPSRIDIAARESLTITDSGIRGQALGLGTSADIQISAPNLTVINGGVISSATFSPFALGGTVQVQASKLLISGSSPTNSQNISLIATASVGGGNAGALTVSTQQLSIFDGGSIGSTTLFGNGNAGAVTVNADAILVSGISPGFAPSNIGSVTFSQGNSGSVLVNTRTLVVRESGSVSASSLADGSAGSVTVNASDSIQISGRLPGLQFPSDISSSVAPAEPLTRLLFQLPDIPTGDAQDVTINTPRLEINDIAEGNRASVAVVNLGTGNGGRLIVNASSVRLNGGALVATTLSGNGGNIAVSADLVQMQNSGKIATTAGGVGNGGNIDLNAAVIVGIEDSDIVANAFQGRGGNIQITTQGIFGLAFRPQLTPNNDITASSQFGISGTVQVNTIGNDPNSGLLTLPASVTDSSQQIAKGCIVNQDDSFIITGRGGLPENPTQELRYDRPWGDLRDLSAFRKPGNIAAEKTDPNIGNPSKPFTRTATSWIHHPNGMVEMVATHAQPTTALSPVASCSGRLNG